MFSSVISGVLASIGDSAVFSVSVKLSDAVGGLSEKTVLDTDRKRDGNKGTYPISRVFSH